MSLEEGMTSDEGHDFFTRHSYHAPARLEGDQRRASQTSHGRNGRLASRLRFLCSCWPCGRENQEVAGTRSRDVLSQFPYHARRCRERSSSAAYLWVSR